MYLPRVHSGEPKLPSDRRRPVSVNVPPSWFRTTSTAFSARKLRVCCTPQPVKGSPRFESSGKGGSPEGGLDAGDSPRSAFRTLRRVSLVSSRTRITAAVALLSLPSCPAGGSGRSRGPPTAIPADARGVLPWDQPGGRGARGSEELEGRVPGTTDQGSEETWGLGRGGSEEPQRPGPPRGHRRSEERRACLATMRVLPCREGTPRLRRAGSPNPVGKREGGAPKSTVTRSRKGPAPRVGWFRRSRDRASGLRRASAAMPGMTGVRARRMGTGCEEGIPMR
jgi:hypothetical protein